MKWEEIKDGAIAEIESGDSTSAAMNEFWQHVLDVLLPKNAKVKWDVLRVELWSDSGRFIVFPAVAQKNKRIEKYCSQLIIPALCDQIAELDELAIDDEEAYDEETAKVERPWIDQFLSAARESDLSGIPLQLWQADDEILLAEEKF